MDNHSAPMVSAVTLGVRDVELSLAFYTRGLGFRLIQHLPEEIAFVQVGHGLMLALWNVASMPSEYGNVDFGPSAPPVSLGHNVADPAAVEELHRRALAAGAISVTEPGERPWGGTSACVADLDGYRWDFVHNPAFAVDDDGRVSLGS